MRRVLRGIKNSKVETALVSVRLGPDTCGRRREGEWNIAMRQKKNLARDLVFWLSKTWNLYKLSEILFQLWIIGNVTSWGIILSVIIHVDLNKLNSHCGVVSFLITSSTFISRPKWSTLIKLPFIGSWASVKGSFLGTLVNTSFLRAS